MTTSSTFYHDGYADAAAGRDASPPDPAVYHVEYMEGFMAGLEDELSPIKGSVGPQALDQ